MQRDKDTPVQNLVVDCVDILENVLEDVGREDLSQRISDFRMPRDTQNAVVHNVKKRRVLTVRLDSGCRELEPERF